MTEKTLVDALWESDEAPNLTSQAASRIEDLEDDLKEIRNTGWIDVEDRLPDADFEKNWRTAKAYPVYSTSVGLTYAYLTRQGWTETHRFGNSEGKMADTDNSDYEIMLDVEQWYDIQEPAVEASQ